MEIALQLKERYPEIKKPGLIVNIENAVHADTGFACSLMSHGD
jgi:hypothetical protein